MSVPVSSGFLTAVTAGMTVLSLVGSLNAGDAAFEIRPGQRQLFLDDVGIEHKAGLHRTMHKLEKRGGVIHGSLPTENIQTRTAPLWDPDQKLFKTWVFGKHFGRIERLDLIPIIRRHEEFGPAIVRCLREPGWYMGGRERLVRDYVGDTDSQATARLANLALTLAAGKTPLATLGPSDDGSLSLGYDKAASQIDSDERQ